MTLIPDAIEPDWITYRYETDYQVSKLTAAIHMLHEQAHGAIPFRSCPHEPCRTLYLDLRGPAPLSLPLGGGW